MTTSVRASLLVALVLVVSVALLPWLTARAARGESAVREIQLVVSNMQFRLGDDVAANPTLRVKARERIRLVLTNDDRGIAHDLAIPAWNVGTALLQGKGTSSVEFTVPDVRGRYDYHCTPHSTMMRGTIEVE